MRGGWIIGLMSLAWPAGAQDAPHRPFESFVFAGAPVLHLGNLPAGAPVISQTIAFARYGILRNDVTNISPKGILIANFTLKAGTPMYQTSIVEGEAEWCTVPGQLTFPICLYRRDAAWMATQAGDMTTAEHEWTATEPVIDEANFAGRIAATVTVDRVTHNRARLYVDVTAIGTGGKVTRFAGMYPSLTAASPDLWIYGNGSSEILHFDSASGRLSAVPIGVAPVGGHHRSLHLILPFTGG